MDSANTGGLLENPHLDREHDDQGTLEAEPEVFGSQQRIHRQRDSFVTSGTALDTCAINLGLRVSAQRCATLRGARISSLRALLEGFQRSPALLLSGWFPRSGSRRQSPSGFRRPAVL